ncbi:hypothetical protein [Streptomyces sp. NRRL B-24720]|nr:hypothetical protein [Streptomyces sp. NRRL B-24720]
MNTAHEASASVLHERRGGVLAITLNRPAQKSPWTTTRPPGRTSQRVTR